MHSDHRGNLRRMNDNYEGMSQAQVEGFMQQNNIHPPPESVASMMSMPITAFEDTQ